MIVDFLIYPSVFINMNPSKINCDACGHIDFSISSTGLSIVSDQLIKVTLEEDNLKIVSKDTGQGLGGISISGGNIVMCGNIIGNIRGCGGSVYINGQRWTSAPPAEDKDDPNYKLSWNVPIISPLHVRMICLSGSAEMIFHTDIFNTTPTFHISGSGVIGLQFPEPRFARVKTKISGSGDFHLGGAHVGYLDADVSGSGDIRDFHVLEECSLSVSGSGDIKGTCVKGAQIDKMISGSGKIRLTPM